MVKIIISGVVALILILLIIGQKSYINDTLHTLTNPSERFLSYEERRWLVVTGIVLFILLITLVI